LSFIEFDGVRYWDLRENKYLKSYDIPHQLKSSSLYREDRVALENADEDLAQSEKERLEVIQRNDRKLREKYHKLSHK
jgi:hypothetical protein